jgi:hypothetical protein
MSEQHRVPAGTGGTLLRSDAPALRRRAAEGLVYDASPRALRQRTVNFAAKRLVDLRYVGGLDRATAEGHFRWRPALAPGGLGFRAAPDGQAGLVAAQRRGDVMVEMDDADGRVVVRWNDPGFGEPVVGAAVARPGSGGIVLGPHANLQFDPRPVSRGWLETGPHGRSAMRSRRRRPHPPTLPAPSAPFLPARPAPTGS